MAKPIILVSAEDIDFYLLLDHVLKSEGFETCLASDVEETVEIAVERNPHTIVLDCRPASFSAAETCARLKEDDRTRAIPVVALISQGAEKEHIELLKSGVDDAFTRPISPAQLIDNLRTNRGEAPAARTATNEPLLTYSDIELDRDHYRVRRHGREIHLSPIEFRLLRHLLQNPGRVFTRDDLIGAAWQKNVYVERRTVDVHIGILRRALKAGSESDLIRTVRSVGYALAEPNDWMDDTDPVETTEEVATDAGDTSIGARGTESADGNLREQ